MTKGQHEQNKADPDRKESEQGCQSCDTDGWQGIAEPKSACHVRRSGSEALDHRNRDGVGRRQFARQVVVDSPTEAGSRDHCCADVE